ncbi:MAG: hypothetical protein Q4G52_05735 [Clostridia bacterium]|nr:hypothetical protein [Clostridia bacterium]
MRLGVIMTGVGAHGAAGIGVMRELERRHLEPFAVCGMQAGAWPAALFCSGAGLCGMEAALTQAAHAGARLCESSASSRAVLRGTKEALSRGQRLQQLLRAQAGERIMALCPRPGLFLCRTARSARRVIFSARTYVQEAGAMLSLQASVSFAARAAMAMPPFLSPVEWMGSPLLPEEDIAFACRQMLALGAHRVLVISPQPSQRRAFDALELSCARLYAMRAEELPEHAAVLRVPMPECAGALSLNRMTSCADAGEQAAREELDRLLGQLGMAYCRVLPFRRSLM